MAAIDAPAAQSISNSRTSRRKRKRNDADLDEAERARRHLQRQKQDLAIKLRAQGKVYKPQKAKKSSSKADKGTVSDNHANKTKPVPGQRQQQQQQQHQQQQAAPQREETGTRPEEDVQVIIVPIFWNKRADEKDTVVSIAEQVRDQLQELGISAGLDTTNADTPGQKYRYWEEKGVKVRVELGPRDAQKNQACLAISSVPGEVAKKTTYQIGPDLQAAVQQALAASGSSPVNIDQPHTAGKKQKTSKKHKHFAEAVTEQPDVAVDGAELPNKTPKQIGLLQHEAKDPEQSLQPQKAAKSVLPSGDDLGDEVAIEVEAQEEDKSGKRKKQPVSSPVLDKADNGRSKAKKNKPKVVQF